MKKRVERVSVDNIADFFKFHSGECGWCYCTGWWAPSWKGWTERSDAQNKRLREELFEREEFDGYLLYIDEQPVGWCQVGQRDRLVKLVNQYKLEPNPDIWAITCFVIKPEYRNKGLTEHLLKVILEDLERDSVKTVQAFPKRTDSKEASEHWKGPENLFLSAGFKVEREDQSNPVLQIQF